MITPRPQPHWTPEQAMAVYEWLQALADRFWNDYEDQFLELIDQQSNEPAHNQLDLFDFNDDMPF